MRGSSRRRQATSWLGEHLVRRLGTAIAAVVAALVLGSFFAPGEISLAALLYQADQEVTVLVDHPGLRCTTFMGRDSCSASYEVAIGNTGSELQEEVRVVLSGVHEGLQPKQMVLDLSATSPRASDPAIEIQVDDASNQHVFVIRSFAPGTYVRIHTVDISRRSSDDLGRLAPGYTIEAAGRTVEGDPQGATMGRMLQNVFGAIL